MKTLAVIAFGLVTAGCLGSYSGGGYPQTSGSPDMTPAPSGNGGNGGGGGGGSGGGVGGNGGPDMVMLGGGGNGGTGGGGGSVDMMGTGGTPGTVAYGAVCNINANPTDCQAGLLCEQAGGGTSQKCTKMCPTAMTTDATACPPPSDGFCNRNNRCRMP